MATPHPKDISLGSPKLMMRIGDALAKRGHQVDYLFSTDLRGTLGNRRALYITFPMRVARRALIGRYDVAHVASGDAFLAGFIRRLLPRSRFRLVNQILGMEHIHWAEMNRASARREERPASLQHRIWYGGLRLRQVEASIRLSQRVCCMCRQDHNFILDRGWKRMHGVAVIPPGSDPVYREAPPSALDGATVLFLGTWHVRKGIHDLVPAFTEVVARVPAARLIVAGSHAPAELVINSFPEHVRAAVSVPPIGTETDLLALMRESAVGVLPSRYEGFGMAFLEMMTVGLPVVGTPTGGMPDLIRSGSNGWLVPAADPTRLAEALIQLLSDRDLRLRLGNVARATALKYSWDRTAAATEALYAAIA